MKPWRTLFLFGLLASLATAQIHTYDSAGRLARTTDALGNSVVYRYDVAGNLTSVAVERDVFPPVITSQPSDQSAVPGQTIVLQVATEQPAGASYQWQKDGVNLPGATAAALTLANVGPSAAALYRVSVSTPLGSVFSNAARLAIGDAVAPSILTPPLGQSAVAGSTVRLEVTASGNPAPTFQWSRDGAPIGGATSASLSLSGVQTKDAGAYVVAVSNAAGTVTSPAATLAVLVPAGPPRFTTQPTSLTVAFGGTTVLRAGAEDAAVYQWRRDGVALPNATQSTLLVSSFTAAQAGSYTVEATNAAGRTTSTPATVAVSTGADFGRIVNLSILTEVGPSAPSFKVGTVLGGRGTNGGKPLVIRAVGPSLAPLGVSGVLADPRVDIISGAATVANNDNWGGGAALTAAMAQVGAFPFINGTSRDAAVAREFNAGDYVIDIGGVGGAAGAVIAELYDATPPGTQRVPTPRLVNVSVLKLIPAGTPLTAGFVIGGSNAKTVLIRAVGPSLAVFGVGGFMADPKLALYSGSNVIAANDNWGGDPQLADVAASVGAFALSGGGSRDALLLVTLPPGPYTAQVAAVDAAAGLALVEVYEVP